MTDESATPTSPGKRRLLAAGLLTAVLSVMSVQGCAWDRTDECVAAIAEHGDILMEQAQSVAGPQGAPEVGCDDTGGPPAYATFDLQSGMEDGFDDVLAREGWACSERTDDDLPGVECTKDSKGVALLLTTAKFIDGQVVDQPVGVWLTAEPLQVGS